MNFCQRLPASPTFCVSQRLDDGICGKSARFRYKFCDEDSQEIVLWLCAECFDKYEAQFGQGAWDESTTRRPDDYTGGA